MAFFPGNLAPSLVEEFEGQVTARAGASPIDAKKFHICGMGVRRMRAGHGLPGEGSSFQTAGISPTFARDVLWATLPVNGWLVEEAIMLTMSHAAGANEPAVRDITLGGLLQWAAETTPDRIALIPGVPDPDNRRQWTYAELYAQALRTARALRASFEPGERVAVLGHNNHEFFIAEFGAAFEGVILFTIISGLNSGEI